MIVAMAQNGTIGKDNALPWDRLPGDLPRFKKLTMGKPCIMGRKTFESLPKALEGRLNIVVSRSDFEATDTTNAKVKVVPSVLEAWIAADETGCDEAFIIGGAEVYKQALPSCGRLYLTLIEKSYDGDTKLDLCDLNGWTITDRQYVDGQTPYQNLILERGRPAMAQFLTLERLDNNILPTPRYGTTHSAGLDFAACLTRPCILVEPGTGEKKKFWVSPNNSGQAWVRHDHQPGEIPPEKHADLALLLNLGETILVPLGFKCSFDITCVMKMYVRSSVGLKGIVLGNGTGIIDPDYRGELFAALTYRVADYTPRTSVVIKHGERIVQGVLTHFSQGIVKEGKVDETIRGEGGLGSTGQMVSGLDTIKQAVVEGLPPG